MGIQFLAIVLETISLLTCTHFNIVPKSSQEHSNYKRCFGWIFGSFSPIKGLSTVHVELLPLFPLPWTTYALHDVSAVSVCPRQVVTVTPGARECSPGSRGAIASALPPAAGPRTWFRADDRSGAVLVGSQLQQSPLSPPCKSIYLSWPILPSQTHTNTFYVVSSCTTPPFNIWAYLSFTMAECIWHNIYVHAFWNYLSTSILWELSCSPLLHLVICRHLWFCAVQIKTEWLID